MESLSAQQRLCLPAAWQDKLQAYALSLPALLGSPQAQRDAARRVLHEAIANTLAAELHCDAACLSVQRTAGQAPVLLRNGQALPGLHLSLAYGDALAVWAWSPQHVLGVDVQAVPVDGDDAEWLALAQLYLAPDVWQTLATLQGSALRLAFAEQWAQLEAQLKCAGLPLAEAHVRAADWNAGIQCALLPGAMPGAAVALAWR